MKEEIFSFVSDVHEQYPFNIQMAGISYCDGSYKITRNGSKVYVFEYILKGIGTVEINSEKFQPEEGDIYILSKESTHTYYSDNKNPWTKIWFNISGVLVESLIETYNLQGIHHIPKLNLEELFRKIIEISQTQNKNNKDIFDEAALVFHEIIIKISSRTQKLEVIKSPQALKLKQYIDKNVMSNIRVSELGDLIFRSPAQTIRIFKNEYHVTPYEYLLSKKLEIAKLMLINTNMSIKEIAFSLKFADEHYFSNFFKSKIGSSPLNFRKTKYSAFV